MNAKKLFDLSGKTIVITGAAGFLGRRHAQAVAAFGGVPVLLDIREEPLKELAQALASRFKVKADCIRTDITDETSVADACADLLKRRGSIDVLINNAANNPTVNSSGKVANASRLENFPRQVWEQDLAVGLTGAFLCAKHFGGAMAKKRSGSIINISSDLGLIAPDQRLYRKDGLKTEMQDVKPVTYSVVKTGLIGLTRYLATYWADRGVRCNALCPGGVLNKQDPRFLARIKGLIPMGRMADPNELQGAIVFLASDASSYMTGSVLAVDGGRTCW